ncbi:uncharacterized protein LOC116350417 [Contarinia nasturtii]|uniref:uncharacterized protein LOC116350417 n=1 Tax=Contarinia nasturtii TaxID=265458 RepID=UPI0012D40309|nr:uncharacterized protein LOC116350417 [Contarinia nasturtii]
MESLNCYTERKVTGQLAGLLGFLFGTIYFAFLCYVQSEISEMYQETNLSYAHLHPITLHPNVLLQIIIINKAMVLMFAADILATIMWLWGSLKGKKGLMLKSLILWGASLNLWLGYIFLFTIVIIFIGPDLHYVHFQIICTSETLIPSLTVVLVLFYIILMLIYNAFGKGVEKIFKCDWKLYGHIAGWIMIAFNVGQTLLFFPDSHYWHFYLYIGILLLILNLVAAWTWLYGINKFKIAFMQKALICWLIPFGPWIGIIINDIIDEAYNPPFRWSFICSSIYSITLFYTGLYIFLVCISRRIVASHRNGPERDQFNITYAQ